MKLIGLEFLIMFFQINLLFISIYLILSLYMYYHSKITTVDATNLCKHFPFENIVTDA